MGENQMKVAIFSSKSYDQKFLMQANKDYHDLVFFEPHLSLKTSVLANGFESVCVFVNDQLDKKVLIKLSQQGVKLIALRCAGFNNIDLKAAQDLGIKITRVPAYSPNGVAEHAVSLVLDLNRKIYRAHNRIRDGNFSLEGLLGFEINGKTVGIVGTGKIGSIVAKIMNGFGTKILAFDQTKNPECNKIAQYVSLNELFQKSDIISLHLPLMPETHHMIDKKALSQMKEGVMLINTSRGGLIDTRAVIASLKSGKIGYLGLDVYEEEEDLFFEDLSDHVIQDDIFARLLTFHNVIITGHQAFFTETALKNIAETTIENITGFEKGLLKSENLVSIKLLKK